jgi:hypothetical protein
VSLCRSPLQWRKSGKLVFDISLTFDFVYSDSSTQDGLFEGYFSNTFQSNVPLPPGKPLVSKGNHKPLERVSNLKIKSTSTENTYNLDFISIASLKSEQNATDS